MQTRVTPCRPRQKIPNSVDLMPAHAESIGGVPFASHTGALALFCRGAIGWKARPHRLRMLHVAALLGALVLTGCDNAPQPNVTLWIDNGNSTAIQVQMDGRGLALVNPGGRLQVQVIPGQHRLRAIAPDGTVQSELLKTLGANGRYVYNPGGKNAYAIETRTYDVSPGQYLTMPNFKDQGNPEWVDAGRIDYVFQSFPDKVDIHYDPTDTRTGPVFQVKRTRLDRQPSK